MLMAFSLGYFITEFQLLVSGATGRHLLDKKDVEINGDQK